MFNMLDFLDHLFDSLCLNLSFVLVWQVVRALSQDKLAEAWSLKVFLLEGQLYRGAND